MQFNEVFNLSLFTDKFLAPEGRFSQMPAEIRPYYSACTAPEGMLDRKMALFRGSLGGDW